MAWAAGRTLGVVSQHQFDPAARFAHKAVAAGQLTSMLAELARWRGPAHHASGT
ncbi:hypothetical protein ACIQOU_03505 [Streptomyces sp. NPDC091279]|uniref:hypothetical protein n=1 Tax=Streptomyces sp. NPDC091279 TaxID=3365983 RepID=UPI00382C20BC